jgi:hypothetical protein
MEIQGFDNSSSSFGSHCSGIVAAGAFEFGLTQHFAMHCLLFAILHDLSPHIEPRAEAGIRRPKICDEFDLLMGKPSWWLCAASSPCASWRSKLAADGSERRESTIESREPHVSAFDKAGDDPVGIHLCAYLGHLGGLFVSTPGSKLRAWLFVTGSKDDFRQMVLGYCLQSDRLESGVL